MSRKQIKENNFMRGMRAAEQAVKNALSVNGNTKEQLLRSGKYTRAEIEALIVGLVPSIAGRAYAQGWCDEIVYQVMSLSHREWGYRFREYIPEPTPEQELTPVEA